MVIYIAIDDSWTTLLMNRTHYGHDRDLYHFTSYSSSPSSARIESASRIVSGSLCLAAVGLLLFSLFAVWLRFVMEWPRPFLLYLSSQSLSFDAINQNGWKEPDFAAFGNWHSPFCFLSFSLRIFLIEFRIAANYERRQNCKLNEIKWISDIGIVVADGAVGG